MLYTKKQILEKYEAYKNSENYVENTSTVFDIFNKNYSLEVLKGLSGIDLAIRLFGSAKEEPRGMFNWIEHGKGIGSCKPSSGGQLGVLYKDEKFVHYMYTKGVGAPKRTLLPEKEAIKIAGDVLEALKTSIEIISKFSLDSLLNYQECNAQLCAALKKINRPVGHYWYWNEDGTPGSFFLKYYLCTFPDKFSITFSPNSLTQVLSYVMDESEISEIPFVKNGQISLYSRGLGIDSVNFEFLAVALGFYAKGKTTTQEFYSEADDYDPGISAKQWQEFFSKSPDFNNSAKKLLAAMMDIGGEATCTQLAEQYGNTPMFYNTAGWRMAKAAHEYFNCPLRVDETGKERYWNVLFTGKEASADIPGNFVWKLRPQLYEALEKINIYKYLKEGDENLSSKVIAKNTILYGPPGTGKTYHTAIYAVAICDELPIEEVSHKDYVEEVLPRYRELIAEGRVAFTTFHQSYGYEDFIEGIRPVLDGAQTEQLEYTLHSGVFKTFCKNALSAETVTVKDVEVRKDARVWSVLLGGTGSTDVKKMCFDEGSIRIGWDATDEYVSDETENLSALSRRILLNFQNEMEIGDIVVSCKTRNSIDGIGVIVGDYTYDNTAEYPRMRKVEWIAKNIDKSITELNGGVRLDRKTVYQLGRISANDLLAVAGVATEGEVHNVKPCVFIIDEINRGNISKIFGELITLIEPTKRAGEKEATSAILPYSGEKFSVPSNVYILGTMNTADRSIALMDTALRRRFHFEEMMPNASILSGITVSQKGKHLDVSKMLEIINSRIEVLYDREHTIGHAFFTKLDKAPPIEDLAEIFKNSIIPLLQEYFYDDYSKIQLVLGDNAKSDSKYKFIADEALKAKDLFKGNIDIDIPEKRYYVQESAFELIESYIEI